MESLLSRRILARRLPRRLRDLAIPTTFGVMPGADYVERVNRAIDHVRAHLDEPLPLARVAHVACFSPFHFHRVFRSMTGETLADFVRRLRLERALHRMVHGPAGTLTEIAHASGFGSSSEFSRRFKAHFGTPPSAFDAVAHGARGRAALQTIGDPHHRDLLARRPDAARRDAFPATLRALPPRSVAYVRVDRPFEADRVPRAAERLVAWARRRGLEGGQWLGSMWEDPDLVPLDQCRYDVAVEVPPTVAPDGEVGVLSLPAMTVAEVPAVGPIDVEVAVLDWLFGTWLPTSGHDPAQLPAFEAWNGLPFAHGMAHFDLRVQLPVEPSAEATR